MSKPKRHHLVPRLYLKNFSLNGKQIYAFIKNLGECKLVSIKDVAVKENFYTMVHKDIAQEFIESYLSHNIEPLWGECISHIIQYVNKERELINLKDICRCLICQYYRGTDFREEAKAIQDIRVTIYREILQMTHQDNNNTPKIENYSLAHAYETFLNEPLIEDKISQILKSSDWSIMTSSECHFITSDRPVLSFFFNKQNNLIYYTKTDIGSPSSYILIAITPNILLQIKLKPQTHNACTNERRPIIVKVNSDYVKSVNYFQQLNCNEHLYGKYKFDPKINDYTIDSES